MASLKEKLASIIAPSEPNAVSYADLLNRKSAAKAAYDEAARQYQQHSLGAERGAPGSIAALSEAKGAMTLAEQRLRDIESAILEHDAEQTLAAKRALLSDHERRGRELLKITVKREQAASALTGALAKASEAYAKLAAANSDITGLMLRNTPGHSLTRRELEALFIKQLGRAGLPGGPGIALGLNTELPFDAEIIRANDLLQRGHDARTPK